VVKSKSMRWAGYLACMDGICNNFKLFVILRNLQVTTAVSRPFQSAIYAHTHWLLTTSSDRDSVIIPFSTAAFLYDSLLYGCIISAFRCHVSFLDP
jgi:hypothetical protein